MVFLWFSMDSYGASNELRSSRPGFSIRGRLESHDWISAASQRLDSQLSRTGWWFQPLWKIWKSIGNSQCQYMETWTKFQSTNQRSHATENEMFIDDSPTIFHVPLKSCQPLQLIMFTSRLLQALRFSLTTVDHLTSHRWVCCDCAPAHRKKSSRESSPAPDRMGKLLALKPEILWMGQRNPPPAF